MILIWECDYCKDCIISNSNEHHKMDTCKCGKSSIDMEEHYTRSIGIPKTIIECSEENFNKIKRVINGKD